MRKLTIRINDNVFDKLSLKAKENLTSVNKIVNVILEKYINEPSEINYLKELDEKLKMIFDILEKISKSQYKHFKLSKQQFANFGYLSNADVNEDKCLNEILNSRDSFNG